jgi:ribonuclease VapC
MAILNHEDDAPTIADKLENVESCTIAAPTVLELAMVAFGRFGDAGQSRAMALLDRMDVQIIDFDADMAAHAIAAFRRFGKGRHPARLNFGDCISYALAKHLAVPLLCKGDDFPLTDAILA